MQRGAMSEKPKKKRERDSPDTGIRQVIPVPVSDTTPKMTCQCNLGTKVSDMFSIV